MKNWKTLVKLGRVIELKPPSATDLTQRIQIARLVFEDSKVPGLRPSRRFQILYEAAYRWCDIVIKVEGWRTKGEGHHETLFSALPHFLGSENKKTARFLDRCRRRRNVVSYGVEYPPVTEKQVKVFAKTVEELDSLVMAWLESKHPEFTQS